MALVLHVLKRLVLVVIAYLIGLVVGLLAIIACYAALSSLPGASEHVEWMVATAIVTLLAPPVALLAFLIAVFTTALPMLVAALVTELFQLRYAWLHMLMGTVVSVAGYMSTAAALDTTVSQARFVDLAVVIVAGVVAGIVYWAICGRRAGFQRDRNDLAGAWPVSAPVTQSPIQTSLGQGSKSAARPIRPTNDAPRS